MLSIQHTANLTGATIMGDFWDLDELFQAFHTVLGDENKYYDWEGPRKRLLEVANDIHAASRGKNNLLLIGNGLSKDSMVAHEFVGPDKNVYFSFEILWPELLFTTVALNDFIRLYTHKHKYAMLDIHVTTLRKFQSLVGELLEKVSDPKDFIQFMTTISSGVTSVEDYAVQYVDMMNLQFIDFTKEQRTEILGKLALKFAVPNPEYDSVKEKVIAAANPTKSSISDMSLKKEYPEEIEW
ncbi:DUF6904 family protein [Paenisporosarcina cavernae]|uniref:Uncharacterized protein n=1 Tax=Paenisporosarcina cavernae TaxID=2320858 RepID=A0A385YQ42_9BACL|nr:hypothetical protein [Paenisporosarcina cavernae]AYC28571.1 hypothetical protein D3873_01300 [Paenisporosarcina cavernae]